MGKILKSEHIDKAVSLENRLELEDTAASSTELSSSKIVSPKKIAERKEADGILAAARAEAEQIKARARLLFSQVEEKTKEAEAKGFAEGREQGLQSVTELLTKIHAQQEAFLSDVERQTLVLLCDIAEKIMGQELATSDEALLGMIRQALQEAMGKEMTILVNPEDFERLRDRETALASALHGNQNISFRPSEKVPVGGCIIESEMGSIEARLDVQMQAIRRAVGVES